MKKKALLLYISMSGNTEETGEMIASNIQEEVEVDMIRVGRDYLPTKEEILEYDLMIVGTYTWGQGETPVGLKNAIAEMNVKHPITYVYGTGDTQFGGDNLFCLAADKLAKFYNSPLMPLKIEQSPRGSQEKKVSDWSQLLLRSISDILN